MTHRRFLLPVLWCIGSSLLAAGCTQGPWGWGKSPSQDASANAGALPGGAADPAAPAAAKPDEKMPKNPLALARLSERRGQLEQAERLYLEIIKKSPKDPAPYHRLAVLYARRGKMKQAEENFARALALKADDPELLSDAGYFYYLTGRAPQAEQHLRRALELEPGNKKYCTNLALAVGEQGRRDEAYALFRRSGSDLQANANLAFVHSQRGEYQQAIQLYDRALTDDPTMRVAADAMIELSKVTSRKPLDQPSAVPQEGRPALASHSAAASNADHTGPAPSAGNSLVMISEGRPVAPASQYLAGVAQDRPPAGTCPATPAESQPRPTAYHYPKTPDAGTPGAAGTPVASSPYPQNRGSQPESPPEVACAFVAPSPAPAQTPAALAPPSAVQADPSDTLRAQPPVPAARRSQAPTASPRVPFGWRPETLALVVLTGVVLMGAGTIPLLRRRRTLDASRASHGGPRRSDHRSGRHPHRQRGARLRSRPVVKTAGRSRP